MKKLLTILLIIAFVGVIAAGCGQNAPAASSPAASSPAASSPAASSPAASSPAASSPAASSPAAIDVSKLRLVMVTPYGAHPYWMQVEDGMKAANKDLGTNCEYTGPSELSLDEQIKAIETAIAAKVDGIITNGYVPETFKPVFAKAKAAGIPVVLVDADAPNTDRTCYIGTSNKDAGVEAGKAMAKLTNGKAVIGILTGPLDSVNLNDRIDGFKEAIKDSPDMKIVATESTDADLLKATEKAQTMLQAYPDMTAMFGVSGNDIVGAGKIVEEKKLTGKITLVGFDDLDQTLDYIRKGVVTATTVQKPFQMGYLGVKTVVEIIKGNPPANPIIDTGVTIVDKTNIDTYKNAQ